MKQGRTRAFLFALSWLAGLAIAFACGMKFSNCNVTPLRFHNNYVSLVYPEKSILNEQALVGNWVLTNQSVMRLKGLAEEIDLMRQPSERYPRKIRPTAMQMMLCWAKSSWLVTYPMEDLHLGTLDNWPINIGQISPLDTEIVGWEVVDSLPERVAGEKRGDAVERVKSWLRVSWRWGPDLSRTIYFSIGRDSECMVLRRTVQFEGQKKSAVLEWRKVSDSLD